MSQNTEKFLLGLLAVEWLFIFSKLPMLFYIFFFVIGCFLISISQKEEGRKK